MFVVAGCQLQSSWQFFGDNLTVPRLSYQALCSVLQTDLGSSAQITDKIVVLLCGAVWSVVWSVIVSSWNLRRCPVCTLTGLYSPEDWWGAEVYAGPSLSQQMSVGVKARPRRGLRTPRWATWTWTSLRFSIKKKHISLFVFVFCSEMRNT